MQVIVIAQTVLLLLFGGRLLHDTAKKKMRKETYAIQNVGNGMDIRVYNAGVSDGTKIILYPHHNWECMTWQLVKREDESVCLKNLYTEKGFEASGNPADEVSLEQKPLSAEKQQAWIIEEEGENCRIRLAGTELYLSASADKPNAKVRLKRLSGGKEQLWRLVSQQPVM